MNVSWLPVKLTVKAASLASTTRRRMVPGSESRNIELERKYARGRAGLDTAVVAVASDAGRVLGLGGALLGPDSSVKIRTEFG